MVTELGKYLRILRVNHCELLGDMARKLNVSPAFLSRVENGLSKPSAKIEGGIISSYNLTEKEIEQFREIIQRVRQDKIVKLEHLKPENQEFVKRLAQSVDKLSQSDQNAILEIIENCKH